MNLRTITGDTRARLEHSEVRHERALQKSQQEVQALKTQLEEEEYILRLEKEAVTLRAKNQRMKDKKSLQEAGERQDRLQELVAAAEMCSVNLGRKLRVQTAEAVIVNARCEAIGTLAEQEGNTAKKAKD